MAGIIKASINLTEIPKDKIVAGKKGQYLNIIITSNDEPDKFGNNAVITVDQTKEERDNKVGKVYLGNGKTVWTNGDFPEAPPRQDNGFGQQQRGQQPAPAPQTGQPNQAFEQEDDLPF